MHKVGIIPASGEASRFGGIPKELLPLPDGQSLLQHALARLSFCDDVVVVTNPEKIALHLRAVGDNARLVFRNGEGMWGAIQTGMNAVDGDQYYMTMPDTYLSEKCFLDVPKINFAYGYFLTNTPERFGVLKGSYFEDKPKDSHRPAVAWGVLTWSRAVRRLWNLNAPADYTEAINMAMFNVNWGHWAVGPYFDCANVASYLDLLDYLRKENHV